jgi:hypothetical protein
MDLGAAMERQFGADWRAAPPLTEMAVAGFEAIHGIELPAPYRSFVTTEANGAVGPPYYGLVKLGSPSDTSGGHMITNGSLVRPFPLMDTWIWESAADPDETRLARVNRDGFVPLGTDGCTMDYVLIVSGAARGQVWQICDVRAFPVAADFGAWIEGDVLPDAVHTLGNRHLFGDPPLPGHFERSTPAARPSRVRRAFRAARHIAMAGRRNA